ncbi:MAG: type II methionyl aminopeptidase [Thermosphaera sp.]
MVSDEELRKLLKAGEIARRVREEAARVVKPGARLIDVAEHLENRIRELGGSPAFPINIGINEVAAHYTPLPGDASIIPDNSVVKIDIGVHVDGYIADTATTLCFNPVAEGLVESARRALERVVEVFKPGVRASEIGRVVEETIKGYGFKPIRNLSGHSISAYTIHAGLSIPNYHDFLARFKLERGVYAVEPFATNGAGLVRDLSLKTIYALKQGRRARLPPVFSRIYDDIYGERRTLPFAERWYSRLASSLEGLRNALAVMERNNLLISYPVLVEREKGLVAQFEHTFIVLEKEVVVTTL